MKKFTIIAIVVIIIIGGFYLLIRNKPMSVNSTNDISATGTVNESGDVLDSIGTTTESEENVDREKSGESSIGTSVEGNDIRAYHFGTGSDELLFVGGIHGGYEWNTALLAYQTIDYLKSNPDIIPENVTVTVIPVLNPDGLEKVVGTTERFSANDVKGDTVPGRFNAHEVDLNRNFDCDWQASGTWQNKTVSGGSSAFSEPESQAIQKYVESHSIKGAVVWYSAAGGVFSSNCHRDVLPETLNLTSEYASASGYKAFKEFNFYDITGDMVNWLAKNDIPAISVLLSNHTDTEWDKNKAGIDAILKHYTR